MRGNLNFVPVNQAALTKRGSDWLGYGRAHIIFVCVPGDHRDTTDRSLIFFVLLFAPILGDLQPNKRT